MKIIVEGKAGEGKSLMATKLQLFLASCGYSVRLAVDHNLPHQTMNENLEAMNSLQERVTEVVIEERQSARN